MIITHMVENDDGSELSRDTLTVILRSEKELVAWMDEVRDGFPVTGFEDRQNRYWGQTAGSPHLTHYWWASSPLD